MEAQVWDGQAVGSCDLSCVRSPQETLYSCPYASSSGVAIKKG